MYLPRTPGRPPYPVPVPLAANVLGRGVLMRLSQLLLEVLQCGLSLRRGQLRNAALRQIGIELLLHFRISKRRRSRGWTMLCKPRLGRRKADPPGWAATRLTLCHTGWCGGFSNSGNFVKNASTKVDEFRYRTVPGCHPKTASVSPTPTVSTGTSSGTSVGYSACVSRPPGT